MSLLTLGVIGTSAKENEHRLPLHPEHLSRLAPGIAARTTLEHGYAERFGFSDDDLAPHVAGFASRDEILRDSDVVVLPKPQHEDVAAMHAGQVLWGWPHCVQDTEMTQLAIDRELTLIAFEAMNHWTREGNFGVHVFHKNNELAGYCSVLHALQLIGSTGDYGRRLRAAVISFGATARGAVTGLSALGISDVTVLTQREVSAVASPFPSVRMLHFDPADLAPVTDVLTEYDVVVNCILQDTDRPLIFVTNEQTARFAPGTLFVDVSCDEGMGFEWARPTSFADPMFTVGDRLHYYAVDHSPSYLWNSATWENSEALLEYVPVVMSGPAVWDGDETIRRAIEIREGRIENPRILSFQGRSRTHPYPVL